MDDELEQLLERSMAPYFEAAPADWIRIVLWCGRLLDTDGSTAGFKFPCVAVTWDGTSTGQQYVIPPAASMLDPHALDAAVGGRPEEGWTMLRVELDRDGEHRYDFSREEGRPLDDSATDDFWDGIHEYLSRNGDEVGQLVVRLREQGGLPDGAASEPEQAPGRLGRMFGRR
jgi:hypothetical protein